MSATLPPPTTADLRDLLDDRTQVMPVTVEAYHRMIDLGEIVEGDPYELLGGQVVRIDRSRLGDPVMSVHPPHYWCVRQLEKLDAALVPTGCHMRTQAPLTLPPFDEPEPDGAVVRGGDEAYRTSHPEASDVLCVIEVADSSLRRDRGLKLRIYAASELPLYLIVNLPERCVELHKHPQPSHRRYARSSILTIGDTLTLPTPNGPGIEIDVATLLP